MALNLLPDADSDGTVNCGPGWIAGAYDPEGGDSSITVADRTRVLIQAEGPVYFKFGDLKATPGGSITVDPPGTVLVMDFSA
ncbi:MAG TPA: hypothetical protein VK488_03835 [Gaiellaceae bacterium]|nr:hypothetical protein [Gaiellaceae bacterium]